MLLFGPWLWWQSAVEEGVLRVACKTCLYFLLWTLYEYFGHRLYHFKHPWNFMYPIHQHHHQMELQSLCSPDNRWPKPLYFLWWFDNFYESVEIWIGETIPLLVVWWFDPISGSPLLVFHYIYELLATDSLLEHNANLEIPIMAVGKFHIEHHVHPNKNFGFTINIWDKIFGTFVETKGTDPLQYYIDRRRHSETLPDKTQLNQRPKHGAAGNSNGLHHLSNATSEQTKRQ